MRMPSLTLALLGSLALAGCAHDEPRAGAETRDFAVSEPADVAPPQKIARYADEDRDGVVTRKEAKSDPALTAAFDRYDADDNDKLDRGEFARLEADARERQALRHARNDDRWMTDGRPDGYFGPEPEGESLNRTGANRDSD